MRGWAGAIPQQKGIYTERKGKVKEKGVRNSSLLLNLQVSYDLKITQRDNGNRIEQEVSPRAA